MGRFRVTRENATASRCDERVEFRTHCEATARNLTADLEAWRYQRGLWINFQGGNWWGLGHALPAVVDLHRVCRVLQRFCYITMYEMRLSLLFGYGNGMSWHPDSAELARYDSNVTIRYFPLYAEFLQHARDLDNYSLIIVNSFKPISSVTQKRRWWYGDLPLPPDRSATRSRNNRGSHETPPSWITRCFVRFVTFELFRCARDFPSTLYHLRTGFADVHDHDVHGERRERNFTAIAQWLNLSCPTLHDPPRLHVISDSPGIVAYYKALGGAHLSDADKLTSNLTTRSWSTRGGVTSFDTQSEIARDLCEASGAEEVYYDTVSAFIQPLVARSMCIRRIHSFMSSRCQPWLKVFSRDLYINSHLPPRYRQMQDQFNSTHPCYRVTDSRMCRKRFLDATA